MCIKYFNVKSNYADLKIIDVGIFIFFTSLKYLFPFIFYLSGGKTYQRALVLYFLLRKSFELPLI